MLNADGSPKTSAEIREFLMSEGVVDAEYPVDLYRGVSQIRKSRLSKKWADNRLYSITKHLT